MTTINNIKYNSVYRQQCICASSSYAKINYAIVCDIFTLWEMKSGAELKCGLFILLSA